VFYISPFDVVPFCFFPISFIIIPHLRLGAQIYLFPLALTGPEVRIYHVSTAAEHPNVVRVQVFHEWTGHIQVFHEWPRYVQVFHELAGHVEVFRDWPDM
jgi:hypothetical protein